ncbi:MAG: 2-C-methyl-D-erythritol 2,4-cyclodiphosphate synthase [Desulfobacca sp.]|uniref:2-C-methyl-D-erythritol 2,4-cyclodiphosphate synthase n=1 Tax=Desulfobacca sp. TaxID=2067990 RepID=UPI00404B868C
MSGQIKVGFGYDVHRLAAGRPLILGGVRIPFELGLAGHSDADVLSHAIGDALLGAVAAGDLGRHFPDSDPKFKGISSLLLLEQIIAQVRQRGYQVGNVDATIVAQAPKLAPYIPAMINRLCPVLQVQPTDLNIKATTTEGLGFTGQGQGIAAYAVVLVAKLSPTTAPPGG